MIELRIVEFSEEVEKVKESKSNILKNTKKPLDRNRDFRSVTHDTGKGKIKA